MSDERIIFQNQELEVTYINNNTKKITVYPDDLIDKLNQLSETIYGLLQNTGEGGEGGDFNEKMDQIKQLRTELGEFGSRKVVKDINIKNVKPQPIARPPPPPPPSRALPTESPNSITLDDFMNTLPERIKSNYNQLGQLMSFDPSYPDKLDQNPVNSKYNFHNNFQIGGGGISDNIKWLYNNKTLELSKDLITYNITNDTVVLITITETKNEIKYKFRDGDTLLLKYSPVLSFLNKPELAKRLKSDYFNLLGLGGVIVKYFDDNNAVGPKEIFISNDKGVYVKQLQDGGCTFDPSDSRYYGPFKRVFGAKVEGRRTNTNEDVYKFLIDGYGMMKDVAEGKDFRLYAFGFSGSGKTYTFIEGAVDDPPVIVHMIANMNNGTLTADKKKINLKGLSYQVFYPLEHNNIATMDKFNDISKEEQIPPPRGNLQEMTTTLKRSIDNVNKTLREKLYVVPTTNNPNSSRAFTLYKIKFTIEGSDRERSIIFTDMPGNEKTTLIKKDFLFSDEVLKAQGELLRTRQEGLIKTNIHKIDSSYVTTTLGKVARNNDFIVAYNKINIKNGHLNVHVSKTEQYFNFGSKNTNSAISFSKDAFMEDGRLHKHIKIILGYMFKNLYVTINNITNTTIEGLNKLNDIIDITPTNNDSNETLWGLWMVDTMIEFLLFFNLKSKLEADTIYILPILREFMLYKDEQTTGFSFVRDFSKSLHNILYKIDQPQDPVTYSDEIINSIIDKVFDPIDECYDNTRGKINDTDLQIKRGRLFRKELGSQLQVKELYKTLNHQFKTSTATTKTYNDFGSPIIYTLLALSTKLVDDTRQGKNGLWDMANPSNHTYRSFVLSLLCFRVISYILKQGNAINTALENHKFHFLKLAGKFNNDTDTKLFNGGIKTPLEGEGFVIDTEDENTHNWTQTITDQKNLRPLNKKLRFKDDTYKINVTSAGVTFEEIIKRTYMSLFMKILYTGPFPDTMDTQQTNADKALTLVAIKRKLKQDNASQQQARCEFAIESLKFAEQISNEQTIPDTEKPTETDDKDFYTKYLKYKNKYMKLKNNFRE